MVILNNKNYQIEDFKFICIQIKNFYTLDFISKNNVENENPTFNDNIDTSKTETIFQIKNSIIEYIRNIAEILIWEDQNDEEGFFELLCEYQIFNILVSFVIEKKLEYPIRKQSLQTISMLFQNIKNLQTIYFLLSNNTITKLLNYTFKSNELEFKKNLIEIDFNISNINIEQEEEELLSYYIALLRSLALRLNEDTIRLFYDEDTNEFPLWKNTCKYINHHDSMIKNTSRNIILNLLRNKYELIISNVIYEELNYFKDLKRDDIFKELNLNHKKLFKKSKDLTKYQINSGLIQIIISTLIKNIHQFYEFVESLNFIWPEIYEYIDKEIFKNILNNNLERDKRLKDHSGLSPIKATSPITVSYFETDSPESYNSPIVNQLKTSFHDTVIKPLMKIMEEIYDILEFVDELFSLKINIINKLLGTFLLQQVFEMVIFQNIVNLIQTTKETSTNSDISLKVYLFLIYQILLFFYKNNENTKYNELITSTWDKFINIGSKNSLFGNIFSTLINYVNEDTEVMILFGLINLYFNWNYFNSKLENRFNENDSTTKKDTFFELNITEEKKEQVYEKIPSFVPNFFQLLIDNLTNYFQQKDEYESFIQEIYNENNKGKISIIEIEFISSIQKYERYKHNCFKSGLRRNKSVPKNWKYKEESEYNNYSDSSKTIIDICSNYKKINSNFEDVIKQIEMELRTHLQSIYSKINCEIISEHKTETGLEYILFLGQFFEKFTIFCINNEYKQKMRPLSLFVILFLSIDIVRNHKLLIKNDCFSSFKSLVRSFLKLFKYITLEVIRDILRMDISNNHIYSLFEKISNINYMLCENLFEWLEEDFLLISKLFENHDKSFIWVHNIISDFCILPKIEISNSNFNSHKYIWNLIDTYPLLRWFPNTCKNDSKSIFIDSLRSNFNNLQIIINFFKQICELDKGDRDVEFNDQKLNKFCFNNKINISLESKPFRVLLIRANKKKKNYSDNIHSCAIFDNSNDCLIFTTFNSFPNQNVILLAQFEYTRCKPVPIITRSYKTTVRYLVALLVRYKRNEQKKYVILDDIMYELPLREDLLTSPNISKGAILQPKGKKIHVNYHLNNLLLPLYTRVNFNKKELQLEQEMNFNDYALYIEFESKKKSQDFIKKLNNLREKKFTDKLFGIYNELYEDVTK